MILASSALAVGGAQPAAARDDGASLTIAAASAIAFAPDKIELRLGPAAAAAARATRLGEAARRGIARARAAVPDGALPRLGVASVDAAAAGFGNARFEPEFRGESPPQAGSPDADFTAFYVVRWSGPVDVGFAAARLAALPEVASAERIPVLPVAAIPNDSLFARSWWYYQPGGRHDIHVPEAWDVSRGDSAVIVAVLDTGVLPYHPDLEGHIATNAAEANGVPGVDDDGNGFVDDVHGWDFVDGQSGAPGEDVSTPDNDPSDFAGHGTMVAGLIGANTDNTIGVAGTAWDVRIMPLRIGWSAPADTLGLVDMSFVAQALRYAARNGAAVANCSFATLNLSGLYAAADAALRAGVTIVAAAGNGQPHDLALRPDVISVAATDSLDRVAGFSNRGPYVKLSAPGTVILSTFVAHAGADSVGQRQPAYSALSGTSFSAPIVAGAAALLQARQRQLLLPPLTPWGVMLRLMETADDISAANPGPQDFGSGRLNVGRALSDPPTSTAIRTGAATIGAPVILPGPTDLPPVAYLTTAPGLLVISGQSADTLATATLPAIPLRQLAGGYAAPGANRFDLFTSAGSKLFGFQSDGLPLPGWPVSLGGPFARASGGPALGDLDGDGSLEVVSGMDDGSIVARHANGSAVAGFPAPASPAGVTAPIALADLDGDGAVEIIAAGADGQVDVVRGDGSEQPGWPVSVDPSPVAPVVTRFAAGEPPVILIAAGATLHAFDPSGVERWSAALTATVSQDPALADMNGDGVDEIVLALDSGEIAVIDSGGVALPGTPLSIAAGVPQGPPVVGPLAPGGRDVLLRDVLGLEAYAIDGTRLPAFPKPGNAGLAPTLADLDGDGATEVLAGTGADSTLFVYDAGAGSATVPFRGWPTPRGDFARTGARDVGPPSPVADLHAVAAAESSVTLRWTSPGNEGAGAASVTFELRATRDSLVSAGPDSLVATGANPIVATSWTMVSAAGETRELEFHGLVRATRYVFALATIDAAGNRARWSNLAEATTGGAPVGPVLPFAGIGIAPDARPSRAPLNFLWRGASGAVQQQIVLYDVLGRRVRTLRLPDVPEGAQNWDGREDGGASVPAGLYFARLISGSVRVQTRVVLLP